MKIFKDRAAAGKLLADRLEDIPADLVIGIPRGGVVVAKEVADHLKLPLDIIITRKISVPDQPELALGAIDPDGEVVFEEDVLNQLDVEAQVLKAEILKEWKELKRRESEYRLGKELLSLERKTIILVDDGIATGATVLSATRYLKRHQVSKIILSVPVASQDVIQKLSGEVDQVVVLHSPDYFRAVGDFYNEFNPVSDEEVVRLIENSSSLIDN